MSMFRKLLKTAMCVGAVFILTGCGPSVKSVEKQLKTEIFPSLFRNRNTFYYSAEVINVTLKEDGKNKYSGEIEFRRNGKICKRQIAASYIPETGETKGQIKNPDYKANPAFLEEDADIYYQAIQEKNTALKKWRLVSAKTIAPQIIRCTVTKEGETQTLDVKCELKEREYGWKIVRADSTYPWSR